MAIHPDRNGQHPIGTGVVIAPDRVLTCAHVLRSEDRWREEVWLAFPKANVPRLERRRVATEQYRTDGHMRGVDLTVMELTEPVPAAVTPARLRCVPPDRLHDLEWWAFGFPGGTAAGNDACGKIGSTLAFGQVRLDTRSPQRLERGFSGSGVWSPDYQAVIGLVVAAAPAEPHGNGQAVTMHRADWELPELELSMLARWTAEAAGDTALAAWGWALRAGPEGGRQWLPRAHGTTSAGGTGQRFQGRAEALTELVRWLDRPRPDGRLLVITGSPGVGKSAVLGRLVATADPLLRGHLPADDDAVRAAVGSVSCAVHAGGKTALDVAGEIARAAPVALPAAAAELVPALRAQLVQRPGRFNLVVDALDEAASPAQARQLVRTVLLPLARECAGLGAQVVVGTRRADDHGDLLGTFESNADLIDLDHPAYFAEPDLAAYAAASLQQAGADRPADHPYTDPAVAGPVARRIAALAGRNFLVAGLVAGAHGRHDTDPVHPDKVSFTPTVDAALDAYLAGLDPAGATSAALALSVLAYAEPPGLPLPLWRAGVAALGGTATEDELAGFAGSSVAGFLVQTNTGPAVRAYRLCHQALGEALLRDREATGAQRPGDEDRLVSAWLAYGHTTGWSAAYDYLLRSLPGHARRAGRVDDLLADDRYLLHADLRRLLPVVDAAATRAGVARARLLQRTPLAVGAGPRERAAMFSVTEHLDRLGSGFTATAGAPYQVRWAHAEPRQERAALEGHANGVLGVCAVPLPGRHLLASGGEDGTVRLWNPATGQAERVLHGHTDWVRALCTIPDGDHHLLATASDDHTVRLWDPATGRAERVLHGHTDWVRALCTIPDGDHHLLATASDDHTVRLWDPATGQLVRALGGHPGWVTAVCPVTVGGHALIAAAGFDTMIRLWDPATGQLARALDGHAGWVIALCRVEVRGRTLLAAAGYDPAIWLWDPDTGHCERVLGGGLGRAVTGLCTVTHAGRQLLAATSEDGTVRLWDPDTGELEQVLDAHTDWVRGACEVLVGQRRLLASAGDDGTIRLWDPDTGAPEGILDRVGPVSGLAIATAGETPLLASTGQDGTVRLWDPDTGAPRRSLTGHTSAVTGVCPVAVGGRPLLASASEDRTIRLWEPDTGRQVRILSGDHPAVAAICAIPGPAGDRLASAGDALRLWNPAAAKIDRVLGHMRWVTVVCPVPLPGGTLLASADEDGVVRLWDPGTGRLERELRCHHGATTALCVVPVGGQHLLASASDDHTVLLWDPATGERVRALHGHTGPVTGLCVVPMGTRHLLASTSHDRTARLWDPATGTAQLSIPVYHRALACQHLSGMLVLGLDAGILALELGKR